MTEPTNAQPILAVDAEYSALHAQMPEHLTRALPLWLRCWLKGQYWHYYDARDYGAEMAGHLPSHTLRLLIYRRLLHVRIGAGSSIHRGCRFYCPPGIRIGAHTVVNRDVLLDGRTGLLAGDNVSISEGAALFSLEHDPQDPQFGTRGAATRVGDRAFIGARAIILPGITIGEGAVVGAGAVVTHNVEPFAIVAGVPAREVGRRRQDLRYTLAHRKFLG